MRFVDSAVILSQYLLRAFDRHLLHHGQREGFEILGEMLALAFPGHLHCHDLPTAFTSGSWRRADNLGLLPKGIQMPPPPWFRMVVANHFDLSTSSFRAPQTWPQLLRLPHRDDELFPRLLLEYRRRHFPPLIQL